MQSILCVVLELLPKVLQCLPISIGDAVDHLSLESAMGSQSPVLLPKISVEQTVGLSFEWYNGYLTQAGILCNWAKEATGVSLLDASRTTGSVLLKTSTLSYKTLFSFFETGGQKVSHCTYVWCEED